MEDDIAKGIEMSGMILLFLVAVSYAFISYNGLTNRLNMFIETNPITKRSEVAQSRLDPDEVKRVVEPEEIILAVLNLGDLNNNNEDEHYSVSFDTKRGEIVTYSYRYDIATDTNIIVCSLGWEYTLDPNKAGSGLDGEEDLVSYMKNFLLFDSYNIRYTNNSLIYSKL